MVRGVGIVGLRRRWGQSFGGKGGGGGTGNRGGRGLKRWGSWW